MHMKIVYTVGVKHFVFSLEGEIEEVGGAKCVCEMCLYTCAI